MDNIPKGYKKTEIGVIPEEWGIETLSEIISVSRGGSPRPIDAYITQSTNGVNWVKIGDVEKGAKYIFRTQEKIKPEGKKYSRAVQCGDFLLSNSMSFGRPYILKTSGCIHDGWLVLQNYKESFDQEFLYYHLSSGMILDQYRKKASGSSVLNLNKELVGSIKVVVPSKEEQKLIATSLSDIDSLITSLEKLIEKKKRIKQGVMQELLTGKRRLPGFSGEWKTKSIEDLEKEKLVKLFRGNVISKNDIANNPGAYPIYSSSIHNQGLFGKYGKYMFDEELITWSVDGGGDFFHRSKHKYSVTNVCGYMRLDTSVINYKFLALQLQLLHSRKNFDYQTKAHPSVIRKEYVLSIPTLEEQQYIAEFLQEEEREITLLENKLSKLKQIKQGAMQQLLTGKIRLINK